jgi:hypothetical protein
MDGLIYIGIFTLGIFAGVLSVRYGIGLGSRMSYKEQVGEPLFGDSAKPTEQEITGDL